MPQAAGMFLFSSYNRFYFVITSFYIIYVNFCLTAAAPTNWDLFEQPVKRSGMTVCAKVRELPAVKTDTGESHLGAELIT